MRKLAIPLVLCFTMVCSVAVSVAVPVLWPIGSGGNGHYYEYVQAPGLIHSLAQNAAFSTSFLGRNGHLVTITTQAEQDFVLNTLAPPGNAWIGAEAQGYSWSWVSFYEGWNYTAWCSGEPNDPPIGERGGAMTSSGCWVDLVSGLTTPGYIVEFEENWFVSVESTTWSIVKELYQ